MATVTVTETGVTVVVRMARGEDGDIVSYSAQSITDIPQATGRHTMGVDITSTLTPAQAAVVKSVLDFIEAKAKAEWNIP